MKQDVLNKCMYMAVAQGEYEIVEYLLKKGGNPNYQLRGVSVLTESAFQGDDNWEITELLIKSEAEIFNNGLFTPLMGGLL